MDNKTIIEAGHYYSVNGPTMMSIKGWKIGKEIAADFPGGVMALFVDDYHTQQDFLESGDVFLSSIEGQIACALLHEEADMVFSEATLANDALMKMRTLEDSGLIKFKKGVFSSAGIRLGTMSEDQSEFLPTCVFLDYILLQEKVRVGGEQVIVLPDTYEHQQTQLAKVVESLTAPGLMGYTAVFHGGSADCSDTHEVRFL